MSDYISIEIIRRYLSGNCSTEEAQAVMEWFNSFESLSEQTAGLSKEDQKRIEEQLFQRIINQVNKTENDELALNLISNSVKARKTTISSSKTRNKILYKRISIAASLVVLFSISLYFYSTRKNTVQSTQIVDHKKTIKENALQNSNKAILTLANGRQINLNDAERGELSKLGKTSIHKIAEGQIAYGNKTANNDVVEYHTMTIPKGGKYNLILADGTKVCLNAASSIRFPTAFTGKERNVELSGEAYFEVAKHKDKPFNVRINGINVQVLGTHFNISAYKDDDFVNTTLIEGLIRINKGSSSTLLKPGYQAIIEEKSDHITLSKADVNAAMAWKNGYFVFSHEDITTVMKKISRWYDIDVEYHQTKIKTNQWFSGTFDRSKSIEELLGYLEKLGAASFTKSGRRVVVMN